MDPSAGASPGANVVDATVEEVLNLGPDTKYELRSRAASGSRYASPATRGRQLERGDRVRLSWAVDDGLLVADPGG